MITRGDVTIERGTSDWGGPLIRISLPWRLVESTTWRQDQTCTFELKHTLGMEGMSRRDRGHGWHAHHGRTWHGMLSTTRKVEDTEAAIDEMIDYLNHLATRNRVSEALATSLSGVIEAYDAFQESLEFRSHRDHNDEWERFIAAVAAADATFRAAANG